VKLNSRKLSLGYLAAFALFLAVSTPAQRLQSPTKDHGARAANSDASAAAKGQKATRPVLTQLRLAATRLPPAAALLTCSFV
jgi:hypothetical protein